MELESHHRTRETGRSGSAISSRSDFVKLLEGVPSILEIGPFTNPLLRGPNVKYFDVLSTEALKQRASAHGLDAGRCPCIDFVSKSGDLSIVSEQFDAVVSCHVIEHQPDLLKHLVDVDKILRTGGRYFLAIPDKRYCFDHYIAESTVADVLDAHVRKRRLHDVASIIEHLALTTHNDAARHWRGDHGEQTYRSAPALIREAINQYLRLENDGYIDVHAWQFVPDSFKDLMQTLETLQLSPYRVGHIYTTTRGSNEFYAILEKTTVRMLPLGDELPIGFDADQYLMANPDVAKAGVDAKQHYFSYGRNEGRKLRP